MGINDLDITIENIRGTYKKFADTLDEYPILGVTFPTHYGYINGYTGEDKNSLDVFLGSGYLLGYINIIRPDVLGGIETKMFLNLSEIELNLIKKEYKTVIKSIFYFKDEQEFLNYLNSFKDEIKLGAILIGVKNLEKSKSFYENVFNMSINEFRPPFMQGLLGEIEFNIEEDAEYREKDWSSKHIGGRKSFSIQVNDIHDFFKKAINQGASIIREPIKRKWGWIDGVIADIDGNEFTIEQEIS